MKTETAVSYVVTMTSGETRAAASLAEAKAYVRAQGLEPVEADGRWECWRSESDACREAVIEAVAQ